MLFLGAEMASSCAIISSAESSRASLPAGRKRSKNRIMVCDKWYGLAPFSSLRGYWPVIYLCQMGLPCEPLIALYRGKETPRVRR